MSFLCSFLSFHLFGQPFLGLKSMKTTVNSKMKINLRSNLISQIGLDLNQCNHLLIFQPWTSSSFQNDLAYLCLWFAPLSAINIPTIRAPQVITRRPTTIKNNVHIPLNALANNANGTTAPPSNTMPRIAQKPPHRNHVVKRLMRKLRRPKTYENMYIVAPVKNRSLLKIESGNNTNKINPIHIHPTDINGGIICS